MFLMDNAGSVPLHFHIPFAQMFVDDYSVQILDLMTMAGQFTLG
ncbi:MAG TPA: hypothetical protein VFB96_11070 [Pirellulaceae bacterium]|nr:hypothetical protein [Pirellulaceae bacterium]